MAFRVSKLIVSSLLLLFFAAGCNGFSCSGDGFEISSDQTFPEEKIVDRALELTVTREGGDFIEQSGLELVGGLLGQPGSGEWLDVSDIVNTLLETNPITFFSVSIREVVAAIRIPNPEGLKVTFLDGPPRVRIQIDEMFVRFETTVVDDLTRSACRIRGNVEEGTTDQRMFTLNDVEIDIELGTDGSGGFDVNTDVRSLNINDSGIDFVDDENDPWYFCNYPECSDGLPPQCGECYVVCGAGDFADSIANFFVEAFDNLIGEIAQVIVNQVLNNVRSVSGRIHPALLLGSLLEGLYDAEYLELGLRPADDFRVTGDTGPEGGDLGVSLGIGLDAAGVHPCVAPVGDDPVFAAGAPAAIVIPEGSDRAHLGLSASEAFVNQLFWGLYKSGSLCLEVDAGMVSELTGGQISLTAGLLSLLLPGLEELAPRDAPILIALKPRFAAPDFPLVTYGSGDPAAKTHSDGTRVRDSLIQVTLKDTALGIYARIDDQFIQLIEVSTDLELGVTPMLLPDARLGVGIDWVELANLRESYDELFASADLEELLGFVAELASNLLVSNEITLPLSIEDLTEALLGIRVGLALSDFARTGASEDWLSLALTLSYSSGAPLSLAADTQLTAEPLVELTRGEPLTLALEPAPPGLPPREVQVRIDGLAWSGFYPEDQLVVRSRLLHLPGHHTLELRARHQGHFRSLDPTPSVLSVIVHEDDAQWAALEPTVSQEAGCQVVDLRSTPSPMSSLWLIVGLALLGVRRRFFSLALVALLLFTACDDEAGQQVRCERTRDCVAGQVCGCDGFCRFPIQCATSADCCGGQACVDGFCDDTIECRGDEDCSTGASCTGCQCVRRSCSSDSACEGGEVCVEGLCQDSDHVPCAGACGEGEVCVRERDVCVGAGNLCGSLDCEPGELVVLTGGQGYVGEQCSYKGLGCDCRPAPALPEAAPGSYVSIDRDGGTLVVSAYEPRYGDLVVMEADASLGLGPATFVDGVPEMRPNADPTGPRGGIGVPGPDVGRYASLAIGPDGTHVIASYDRDERDLRLAVKRPQDTEWTTFTLDEKGDSGRFASVAALPDGRFVVAYHQRDLDGRSAGDTTLQIALSKGPELRSAGDFLINTADRIPLNGEDVPCDGLCVAGEVCVAEGEQCVLPNAPEQCASTCEREAACVGGQCVAILVAPPRSEEDLLGTGLHPDVSVQSNGRHIAVPFYEAFDGRLLAAVGDALGPYTIVTLDEGSNRAGFGRTNVGREAAGVVDASDVLHVAYLDDVSGELRYLQYDIANDTVLLNEVADSGRAQLEGYKLGGLDIALRGGTRPIIAFQDTSSGDVYVTQRSESSQTWSSTRVDAIDVAGFSPSLSVEGDDVVLGFGRLSADERGALSFSVGLKRIP